MAPDPSAEDLGAWLPDHVLAPWDVSRPSAWVEHAPFLAWLIGAHRPRSFIELGTHWGFSYFAALTTARAVGLEMDAMAVDTWGGDEHAGEYGQDVHDFVAARDRDLGYRRSRLFRGYFDQALAEVADGSLDLLHIDGLHTYEASRHDFDSWLPKLSDRGVVLFHDIAERAEGFGVFRTWAEVGPGYPSFAFRHGHGLGVLLVGSQVTGPVAALASADAAQQEAVRRLFEQLGANVAWQSSLVQVCQALDMTMAGGATRAAAPLAELGVAETARPRIARIGELLADRDAVHGRLAEALVEVERTRAEGLARAAELEVERDRLAATIDAITASRSWRATSALRAVGRRVRRG